MKRGSTLLLLLCVALFVGLRLIPAKRMHPEVREQRKPVVPQAVSDVQSRALEGLSPLLLHPWVALQRCREVNVEMVRDLTHLHDLCERNKGEETETLLIRTLTSLQKQIPFKLPDMLYSVLCIPEAPEKAPVPFHIYKRLYLGETELGLPFYLDVRVFEVEEAEVPLLLKWHLEVLEGECEQHFGTAYVKEGLRTRDCAHGFATGVRGLFIDSLYHDGKLFVLYAEAPLSTFKKHALLFKQLGEKTYE